MSELVRNGENALSLPDKQNDTDGLLFPEGPLLYSEAVQYVDDYYGVRYKTAFVRPEVGIRGVTLGALSMEKTEGRDVIHQRFSPEDPELFQKAELDYAELAAAVRLITDYPAVEYLCKKLGIEATKSDNGSGKLFPTKSKQTFYFGPLDTIIDRAARLTLQKKWEADTFGVNKSSHVMRFVAFSGMERTPKDRIDSLAAGEVPILDDPKDIYSIAAWLALPLPVLQGIQAKAQYLAERIPMTDPEWRQERQQQRRYQQHFSDLVDRFVTPQAILNIVDRGVRGNMAARGLARLSGMRPQDVATIYYSESDTTATEH